MYSHCGCGISCIHNILYILYLDSFRFLFKVIHLIHKRDESPIKTVEIALAVREKEYRVEKKKKTLQIANTHKHIHTHTYSSTCRKHKMRQLKVRQRN